jgi:predicted metal-dependent peptidase
MSKSKAYAQVELARTRLVISQPFFGTLALNLTMVEATAEQGVETMATDGRNLYFNSDFVLGMDEEELKGVNAHEVLHCALRHMTRRQHRDANKWNIAADFAINLIVIDAGFKLPWKPGGLEDMKAIWAGKKKLGKDEKMYCYDKQFANMSAEEIYERIPDPPQMPGGSGRIVVDLGGCGAVLDAGTGPGQEPGNEDATNPEALGNDWDANVRMAVAVERAKNAGNQPGWMDRLIKDLKKPKINWKDQTRQFIDQSISKNYTYTRPNRRQMSGGMVLPGLIPDALSELVFIIDISGSVTTEMATSMVSEGASALYDGVTDKLWVVYTDTQVAHVDEFYPGDIVTATARDGGGTDFRAVMEWLPKNVPDAACVVFLTDGECGSAWGEDPGIPTLWGFYTSNERFNTLQPPYGSPLFVESPQ